MMKRILFLLTFVMLMSGCETTKDRIENEKAKYQRNSETITDTTYPDLVYLDKSMKINEIRLMQWHDTTKYAYHPYAILHIDATDLADDEMHYLMNGDFSQDRKAYLDIDCRYKAGQDEWREMSQITRYKTDDPRELVYIYYDYSHSEVAPLDDMQVDLVIEITQPEEGKAVSLYTNDYSYNKYAFKINTDNSNLKIKVVDDSNMTSLENEMFERGLGKIMERGF